jgi:uncharacterized protein (DUF1684 family)
VPPLSAEEDFARWREERQCALQAPDSWLGLIGLFWLEEGSNRVGTDPASVVQLPQGPAVFGELLCQAGRMTWQPAGGLALALRTDAEGDPDVVSLGALSFSVIERGGQFAVRLRDRDWASRKPFAGLDCFPFAPDWKITASWQPLTPPQEIEVPDVTGDLKKVTVAWQAVFRVGKIEVALLPMSVSGAGVFFVFRDASSGKITYGAGRFLHAELPVDGQINLDFNRATNPPCAFTPFATCPLPPPENWLPFPVMAGELTYADH